MLVLLNSHFLKKILVDDCNVESTVVLGDVNCSSEELIEETEERLPEIVAILPDEPDCPLLSIDDVGKHFLTVEDIAGTSLESMPMLSVTAGIIIVNIGIS